MTGIAIDNSGVLNAAIPITADPGSYTLTITANTGAGSLTATFELPVVEYSAADNPQCVAGFQAGPCKREIVFVLDNSGSMNNHEVPGDPSSPTKWSKLQSVVTASLSQFNSLVPNNNHLWDAVFFGNQVNRTAAGNLGTNASFTFPAAAIGGTPMGGGLQMAFQRSFENLNSTNRRDDRKRLIILVTDGAQNVNPMVNKTTYSDIHCYNTENWPVNGIVPIDSHEPALPALNQLGAGTIGLNSGQEGRVQIYSVGVGVGIGTAEGALLAATTGLSNSYIAAPTAAALAAIISDFTDDWMADESPRALDSRKGTTKSDYEQTSELFTVNDSVQAFTLQFFATDHSFTSAQVQVLKDGQAIKNPTQITYNKDFVTVFVDLTSAKLLAENPFLKKPAGIWQALISDAQSTPYQVTAFVEDKKIHHRLTLGNGQPLYAGDPLPVKFSVSNRGKGISKDTVVAVLYRPGDDLGDLAARIATPGQLNPNEPGGSLGQAKIDYAVSQQAIYDSLREKQRIIVLKDEGNGNYTGIFNGNEVTGGYRVIVRYQGWTPSTQQHQGWEMEGAFFDFSRPEDIRLKQEVVPVNGTNGKLSRQYLVRVTPVNKFGRRIGPGQLDRISIQANPGATTVLKDNLDGSYETQVTAPTGTVPIITVKVIDQRTPVYTGPLLPRKFGVSLHAGATFPVNHLDSLYNPGLFAEIDLHYDLNSTFDVELVGGYYGFGNGFNLLGGTAYLGYHLLNASSSWNVRLAAGAGAFKPKNGDMAAGYSGRLEVGKKIGTHLEASLHGAYFHLPNPNYSFFAGGVGLKYYFP